MNINTEGFRRFLAHSKTLAIKLRTVFFIQRVIISDTYLLLQNYTDLDKNFIQNPYMKLRTINTEKFI